MCFGIKGEIVKLEEGNSKTGKGELSNGEGGALKRGMGALKSFYEVFLWELIVSFTLRGTKRNPLGDKMQPTWGQNAT